MISIVMPSYLGQYKRAAKDRDTKIVRAIMTVVRQDFEDWELIVVADGCDRTVEIVQPLVESEGRIRLEYINKAPLWSGRVRNAGLEVGKGEYFCYLDVDDAFAPDHLSSLLPGLNGKDWYWFDDYVWNGKEFRHRKANINKVGRCGTCNLIHKKIAKWNEKDTYAHDWRFINNLKRASGDYEYIKGGRYLVCHIPPGVDI